MYEICIFDDWDVTVTTWIVTNCTEEEVREVVTKLDTLLPTVCSNRTYYAGYSVIAGTNLPSDQELVDFVNQLNEFKEVEYIHDGIDVSNWDVSKVHPFLDGMINEE